MDTTTEEALMEHFRINAIGPLLLTKVKTPRTVNLKIFLMHLYYCFFLSLDDATATEIGKQTEQPVRSGERDKSNGKCR